MKESFMMNDWIEVEPVIDVNIASYNTDIKCGKIISLGAPTPVSHLKKLGFNFDELSIIRIGSLVWFKKSNAIEFHKNTYIIKEKDILKIEFEEDNEKMEDIK